MSAKSPWNTHAVAGIFYPRPFFTAKIAIVSPFPHYTMLNRYPKPLATWKDIISPSSAICITLKQHYFTRERILLFIYSINHRKCSKTFGRHCRLAPSVAVLRKRSYPEFAYLQNLFLGFMTHSAHLIFHS